MHLWRANSLQNLVSAAVYIEYRDANLLIFHDNFAEQNFSVKTSDWLAEQVGFELSVRLAKFAFEFSAEFPASLAEFGFRENFAPEVLSARFHLSLQGPVRRLKDQDPHSGTGRLQPKEHLGFLLA